MEDVIKLYHETIRSKQTTGEADGTVPVLCKRDGQRFSGLIRFRVRADAGDEYTADFLEGDESVAMDPASIDIQYGDHTLKITGILLLPEALRDNRTERSGRTVPCGVTTVVSLPPGAERITFHTAFDNRAKGHCLNVLFPFAGKADRCLSDSVFCVENRQLVGGGAQDDYAGWKEKPGNRFYLKNFAALQQSEQSMSVLVQGLPQFSVVREETRDVLELTLLRCVGWLSRCDLRNRAGNGGWSLQTTDAQMLGSHSFDYALSLRESAAPWKLNKEAVTYTQGLFALQTSRQDTVPPFTARTFLTIDQPSVFVSAFKGAEDGRGWVLRLVNMVNAPVDAKLTYQGQEGIRIASVRLNETPWPDRDVEWDSKLHTAAITFDPWQIKR